MKTNVFLKELGNLTIVTIIVCLVGYVLFPFLAWLTGLPVTFLNFLAILFLLIVGGILVYKKNNVAKYFFFALFGSIICNVILSSRYDEGIFKGDKIIIKVDHGYGVANKWGFTVIPGNHGNRRYVEAKNDETEEEKIIGASVADRERCDDDNDILYRETVILRIYSNGKIEKKDTVKVIERPQADYTKIDDKLSLYEYIESHYGHLKILSRGSWFWEDKYVLSNHNEQAKNKDEYTDLGPIVCYECSNKDDKEDVPLSRDYDYHLYVKTYQGENFYFIAHPGSGKIPVTKGSWTKDGEHYNGKVDLIIRKGYVNISSWSSSGGSGSYSSSNNSGERTIRTESSPQPVQEWVPCPVCGNSGRAGLCQHCNGTGQDLYYTRGYRDCPNCGGLKKCTTCGGSGGHYETRYR